MSNIKSFIRNHLFLFGVLIGLSVGLLFHITFIKKENKSGQLRLGIDGYVNPLVACNLEDGQESDSYDPLKNKVEQLISDYKNNGYAKRVSIYFRDLDIAEGFGINENELFYPASLVKVPVMVAYFKLAEFDSKLFTKKIKFDGAVDKDQLEVYKSVNPSLKSGNYYSVAELIDRMIINSGNNSYSLLFNYINKDILARIYADLDLSTITGDFKNLMSPKSYSFIWRALYNASYLNKKMSNQALNILTKVEFREGITAKLPLDLIVAHKFGERSFHDISPIISRELHDCGIVYYPQHPYFFCIMTEGYDFEKLEPILQNISLDVYSYVSKKYKK